MSNTITIVTDSRVRVKDESPEDSELMQFLPYNEKLKKLYVINNLDYYQCIISN